MLQDEQQRNLVIAIALSMAILLLWMFVFPSQTPKPVAAPEAAGPAIPGPSSTTQAAAAPAAAPPSRDAVVAQSPRVLIETPNVVGSLRLVGTRLDDIRLAKYRETVDPASPAITLLSPQTAPNPYFAELGWVTAAKDMPVPDDTTPWQADRATLTPTTPVTLRWDNGKGLGFERRIAVDSEFLFTITDRVVNAGREPVALQPYGRVQRVGTPQTQGFYILHEGPIGVFNGVLEEPSYDDLKKKKIEKATTGGWIGITDKYWLVALIPDQKAEKTARFLHAAAGDKDAYQADYLTAAITLAPGASAETVNRIFAGAKEVRLLDRYEDELGVKNFDKAVDFGWFYWLTKPIFHVLDFFYRLLGNFGLAILLLTLCVKAAFFPLANKSYRAMSKMKLLAPEMEKLKAKHGNDRQAMSQAMMELYKKAGANPLAGCLPIVLQIPVFFSLYKVLFVTIEMRHAPFYGWIRDLSALDPSNVFTLFGLIPFDPTVLPLVGPILHLGAWPLIMGATMFVQQKLNPAPPDPVQAKVFMMMPFIFTFMLSSFPAGLVIYWAWNNLLSVAQQWVIMRQTAAAAAAKPAT